VDNFPDDNFKALLSAVIVAKKLQKSHAISRIYGIIDRFGRANPTPQAIDFVADDG